MRLVRVELTRLRWRRAIVVLLIACLVVPVVLLVGYGWSTRPFSEGDIAAAKHLAAQEAAQPWVAEQIADCESDPENFLGPGADATECAAAMTPTYENYLYRSTFALEELRTGVGAAAITILTAC